MKLFPKKVDNRPTKDKRISVQLDQRRLKCVQIAPTSYMCMGVAK